MTLISAAAVLLDEVARIGSIRKAAIRLNISPSALNRRILNLEAEYGVMLFERLPRGMRLTAAGELLVNDIRRWRADQERLKVSLQQLQGLRRGHVSVGLMECLTGSFARELFENVQKRHPGLTLEIFVGGTGHNVEKLLAGQLDIAVCFNVPPWPEINKIASIDAQAGVVVVPEHPLAHNKPLRLSDCLIYPLVFPDNSLATRTLIDRAMSGISANPVPSVVTNSIRLMKGLVGDGRHLAFLGIVDVVEELNDGSLRFIPLLDSNLPKEELAVITRNTQTRPPAVTAIQALLKQQLRGLPVGPTQAG